MSIFVRYDGEYSVKMHACNLISGYSRIDPVYAPPGGGEQGGIKRSKVGTDRRQTLHLPIDPKKIASS